MKWDKEYQTFFLKERDFLKEKGIRWTFAKTLDDGTKVYKYAKTKELFLALAEFYDK